MNYSYLKFLLSSLSNQTIKPKEIILVAKNLELKKIEELCNCYGLKSIIIEQNVGFVTHALNLGKKEAEGDIIIFTDDDAIPNSRWIERHLKHHQKYSDVGCISSRDKYLDVESGEIIRTPDDILYIRLYRWLIRPWLEPPHSLLKSYRFGVYLSKSLKILHGPYIPNKKCYSLPFRGVNLSFKKEALDGIEFPEHPILKRGIGWESNVGLQLILNNWKSLYIPNNPILHITHESLSRIPMRRNKELLAESQIMLKLNKKLIEKYI
jgi:cellulose synthase/poly-beta-1,6-N-acetylglucosamine synthase-like glycosyltransferase